jgi:folate-dependent phosphoribosylglycinamide formyltransferase PurN
MNFKIVFIVNIGNTLSKFFQKKKFYLIKNSKRFLVLFLYQKEKSKIRFPKELGKLYLNYKNTDDLNEKLYKNFKYQKKIFFINFSKNIFRNKFLNKFNKKIYNFHPSFLPEHSGLNSFDKAFKSDLKSGNTVFVIEKNKKIDGGKIILKKRYFINKRISKKKNWDKIVNIQCEHLNILINKLIKTK